MSPKHSSNWIGESPADLRCQLLIAPHTGRRSSPSAGLTFAQMK